MRKLCISKNGCQYVYYTQIADCVTVNIPRDCRPACVRYARTVFWFFEDNTPTVTYRERPSCMWSFLIFRRYHTHGDMFHHEQSSSVVAPLIVFEESSVVVAPQIVFEKENVEEEAEVKWSLHATRKNFYKYLRMINEMIFIAQALSWSYKIQDHLLFVILVMSIKDFV